MSIFNAQRAAYCGLILAGIPAYQAMAIVRSSRETLAKYVEGDWLKGLRVGPMPGAAPSERSLAIIRHYQSAHRTLCQTGDAFGITRERVRQILVRHGIPERTHGSAAPEEKAAALAKYREAIANGSRSHEAVKLSGRDHHILRVWALEAGGNLPRPRSFRRERWPEIAQFYQDNPTLNQRQVSEHFKCDQNEVAKALKASGITSRHWRSAEVAARRHAPRSKKQSLRAAA